MQQYKPSTEGILYGAMNHQIYTGVSALCQRNLLKISTIAFIPTHAGTPGAALQ